MFPSYICENILGRLTPSIFLLHRILRDTLRQNVDITATRRSIYHCASGWLGAALLNRIYRAAQCGSTVGIIIPSMELLAQLTARLNGFKYSAPRCALSPAFVVRLRPSRPIDVARNMRPLAALCRCPSLTADEKIFMALFSILSRLFSFLWSQCCTRDLHVSLYTLSSRRVMNRCKVDTERCSGEIQRWSLSNDYVGKCHLSRRVE